MHGGVIPEASRGAKLLKLVPGSGAPLRGIGLMKPWQIAALIGALAIALLTIAWNLVSAGHSVHYGTAMVTRGSITRTVTATGTVNPELTIIVGTYVSGVIQELYCDYNTVVKKGQLCAKIDARPTRPRWTRTKQTWPSQGHS